MNAEQLLYAIGGIRDDFIREAAPGTGKRRHWRRWAAGLAAGLAACLAVLLLHDPSPAVQEPGDGDGAPSVVVEGVTYVVSPYFEHALECPEGFTEAGTVETEGQTSCPYYTSPEHPEWIYVYQQCYDQRSQEFYQAYVRYVEETLRGLTLLRYQGELYIFLNDTYYLPYTTEVAPEDQARYDRVPYESVIDTLPDGFAPIGSAVFDGHDAVPSSELGSNTLDAGEQILANPAEPELLLVRKYWRLEPVYWVYVRYQD